MTTATTSAATSILEQFKWEPQPEAERLSRRLIEPIFQAVPLAATLRTRFDQVAGVRFIDLVDHVFVGDEPGVREEAKRAGYIEHPDPNALLSGESRDALLTHPGGLFPALICSSDVETDNRRHVIIRVESVVDFVSTWQIQAHGVYELLAPLRSARVDGNQEYSLGIVERHGVPGYATTFRDQEPYSKSLIRHDQTFRSRLRIGENDQAFLRTERMIERAIADLGVDRACDLFFAAEREYWQRRNRAAQVQKARQDRLGIGWANHDHHTYRSSRRHFSRLIAVWEKLGFVCRERFYAGKEAGWGAQVMEQPNAGIVTFNDVDLSPDELLIDFAHEPLPERKELGTVGLWCALHGESFLEAGMHHLECMFDFNALKEQLERDHNVGVMKPFTDFPYLKQAFTVGERWPVREERIVALLSKGQITPEQAQKFRIEGAIGSHLENLERNQGFKGFNQTGVSEIIAATDPRKHLR